MYFKKGQGKPCKPKKQALRCGIAQKCGSRFQSRSLTLAFAHYIPGFTLFESRAAWDSDAVEKLAHCEPLAAFQLDLEWL